MRDCRNMYLNKECNTPCDCPVITKTYPKDFKCVVCEKDIKRLHPNDFNANGDPVSDMYNGGIVERISAGYGSRLDGNLHVLAICDECVNEKTLKGVIIFERDCIDPEYSDIYRPLTD